MSAGCLGARASVSDPLSTPIDQRPAGALDPGEKRQADQALALALKDGKPQQWRSDRPGYSGYIEPGPVQIGTGGQCRDFSHAVFIDGRANRQDGRACRQDDGSWQVIG